MAKLLLNYVVLFVLALSPICAQAAEKFSTGSIDFEVSDRITDFQLDRNGRPERKEGRVPDRSLFSWIPSGENHNHTESHCASDEIKRIFQSQPGNVDRQADLLQRWFNRCNTQIGDGQDGMQPLYKALTLYYPMVANKAIKSLKLEMPRGDILRGFIAMKRSSKPRPLVIVKCGIYCNADPIRSQFLFFMHLFDESPFHVITLANVSGSEYEFENASVALGGFHEGRQLYELAAAVQHPNSPYRSRISSVHVMGISLGGHGALFSALYASNNRVNFLNKRVIDSVLAYCPVVNLERSMDRLFSEGAIANLVENYTRRTLIRLSMNIPILREFFRHDYRHRSELKNAISRGATHFYSEWTRDESWPLSPLKNKKINSVDEFFELNNFNRYYQQIRVPTLVLAAQNDRFVRTNENTGLLAAQMKRSKNPNIKSLVMAYGDHCAFSEANGWRNMSILKREFILSHSPKFRSKRRVYRVPVESEFKNLNWLNRLRLSPSEPIMSYNFKFKVNRPSLRVELAVFDQYRHIDRDEDKPRCSQYKPHLADQKDCFRRYSADIPIAKFEKFGFRTPKSRLEASIFTRFANTRFSVLNKEARDVKHTSDFPAYLEFEGY